MRAGEHGGDALSALLDGELGPEEERALLAHLSACAACAADLEAERSVRSAVRRLPVVEPPFGLYERLLLRQSRRRGLVAAAGGVAASLALVVLATPRPSTVDPPVPDLVEVHAAASSRTGDPVSQLAPAGVPVTFRP